MMRRLTGLKTAVALPLAAGMVLAFLGAGCAVVGHGRYSGEKYQDARGYSNFDTPNLESQDIQTACENAVSRLLASDLMNRVSRTPVFVVEDDHFVNDGEVDFDTRALVDLFRNELVNAGDGRLRVLHPLEDANMAMQPDFLVKGRVTDVWNTQDSRTEAYTQIAFNVVLAGSGEVVFSDVYSVKKGASLSSKLY